MRLEMGLEARLQLQQKLVLAPQIIQSIEILQLPSVNLLDYVEQQLNENEALELDTPEERYDPDEERAEDKEVEVGVTPLEALEPEQVREFLPDDWEEFKPRRAPTEERDRKLEALQNTAGRPMSLQDHLADQLSMGVGYPVLKKLARTIIYNLDDDGFLPPHRFVTALLEATDAEGYLQKPLADLVASVDGVAAVKIPKARGQITPEHVAAAQEARERHILEASEVLSRIQRIRSEAGGADLTAREVLLRYPLVEILEQELQEGREWTLDEAEAALALVQALEPRGIGGRDLVEVLVLQLNRDDLLFPEKRQLLENHLEDLKKNRMQRIARDMGLAIEEVQMVMEELKGLDMHPGSTLVPREVRSVHPDVIVEETEDDFTVELVNSMIPALSVSVEYDLLQNDPHSSSQVRNAARKKVEKARWLMDAIQQRQTTLTRVAQRIFHHQRAFLRHGENALRPLKMQTVADELGMHVSTVSRAIADKWAQTPQGVHPLKFFFTGGTENASGAVESRHSVKNRVQAIIDAEDATKPLSDDDVAAKLKEQGLEIARRTVTKYRKQLGIPSSRQRRVWT